jgi:uncharacterized membrane protein YbaN (DUF454 family)
MHNIVIVAASFFVSQPPLLPPPLRPVRHWLGRWLLRVLASVSLTLGVAGIFIPGLPTTVFILLAGWAAARSSPRLHAWLWHHRLFGPMLINWNQSGKVSRKAKYSASIMMTLSAGIVLISPTSQWVRILACSCMACVLAWLWSRPEP